MSILRIRIFTEELLEFCLRNRGITWKHLPWDHLRQAGHLREDGNKLFNEAIGNAVINTSISFQARVQEYSANVCNCVLELPAPRKADLITQKISEVADGIFLSGNMIETIYIFLAVMVEASVQCASGGNPSFILCFAHSVPRILNRISPDGFLSIFDDFLAYAHSNLA